MKQVIVIVEDDESLLNMYSFKLKKENYEVYSARNGVEGLELINKNRPGLVLLDLRMPIMDGCEMLQILRSYSWASDIRIIVLTNISKSEAPPELRFLSVDRYIVKAHHTPKQVVEIVQEVLS